MIRAILSMFLVLTASACNSDVIKEGLELADGVSRKTIPRDQLGINAFANDGRFGSPQAQFSEVRTTLGVRFVRILANWDTNAQPNKNTDADFGFIDTLLAAIPGDVDALIILSGAPSWLSNSTTWTNGDPRRTYIEEWVRPAVTRYANHPRVIGFQVWNEPNQTNEDNTVMGFTDNAARYVDTLKEASSIIRTVAPSKLVVTAATTAINQNYPRSLNYNRAMRDAGAQDVSDIWAIHYYGKQYENVIKPGGVRDFANGLSLPIWVTESGAQGVNKQLAYGEEVWPYLLEKIPGIQRIYVYQFTESTQPDVTYGLRNLSAGSPVSDLYVWLRDNK